jgi:ABC-type multidrug transport system ATPase subunit
MSPVGGVHNGGSDVLAVKGVAFAWRQRVVLRGVDLALVPGTITALRGLNGAGKTTLIRLLVGGLEPQAGRICLGDLDAVADRRSYLRRIGVTTAADRGLYARLDVRANLQLAAALVLLARAREPDLIAATLERFSLSELARKRVDRLSTGQRQRVRLAIAFLHEPSVVLLDEPTASLDSHGAGLLAEALRTLTARGASALWAAPVGPTPELPVDRTYTLTDGFLELSA